MTERNNILIILYTNHLSYVKCFCINGDFFPSFDYIKNFQISAIINKWIQWINKDVWKKYEYIYIKTYIVLIYSTKKWTFLQFQTHFERVLREIL